MDEITAEQLKQRLETGEPLQLIDVREPHEWEIVNLADRGARLIPLGELAEQMDGLDRDVDTVVYCRSGGRSRSAAHYLAAAGFRHVSNLKGGIKAWVNTVDPALPLY
jgi:adenylyltransferase/sulfurtransferase